MGLSRARRAPLPFAKLHLSGQPEVSDLDVLTHTRTGPTRGLDGVNGTRGGRSPRRLMEGGNNVQNGLMNNVRRRGDQRNHPLGLGFTFIPHENKSDLGAIEWNYEILKLSDPRNWEGKKTANTDRCLACFSGHFLNDHLTGGNRILKNARSPGAPCSR